MIIVKFNEFNNNNNNNNSVTLIIIIIITITTIKTITITATIVTPTTITIVTTARSIAIPTDRCNDINNDDVNNYGFSRAEWAALGVAGIAAGSLHLVAASSGNDHGSNDGCGW